MAKKSHDEIIKLTANTQNGMALILFSLGVISPSLGAFLGLTTVPTLLVFYTSAGFLTAAVLLHIAARRTLKRLDDD